jgi:hypothetical protein
VIDQLACQSRQGAVASHRLSVLMSCSLPVRVRRAKTMGPGGYKMGRDETVKRGPNTFPLLIQSPPSHKQLDIRFDFYPSFSHPACHWMTPRAPASVIARHIASSRRSKPSSSP